MRYLITGGAGFIGTRLAKKLLLRGDEVRILDNLTPQVHPGITVDNYIPLDGVDFVYGDVRNTSLVSDALQGIDSVFHLAAQTGVGQSMYEIKEYVDCNVTGTASLWEAIASHRESIKRVVLSSSRAVYGEGSYLCAKDGNVAPELRDPELLEKGVWDPLCPYCDQAVEAIPTREDKPLKPTSVYALTKKMQEELCLSVGRTYGVPAVVLRFFNVYGAGQSLKNPYTGILTVFFSGIKAGRVPEVYEDGLESRDFVHVDDVVDACILAGTVEGIDYQTFNVGTGRPLSIMDAARVIMSKMGVSGEPRVSGAYRVGDIRHCHADLQASQGLLGFNSKISFEDGVAEFLAWAESEQYEDLLAVASEQLRAHGLLKEGGKK